MQFYPAHSIPLQHPQRLFTTEVISLHSSSPKHQLKKQGCLEKSRFIMRFPEYLHAVTGVLYSRGIRPLCGYRKWFSVCRVA